MNASQDFPLVLSMSQFQQFRRCRKMFEYSAVRDYAPKRDSEPMQQGRDFHALVAHAATHGGALPQAWDGTMYDVAQEYVARRGLPPQDEILAAERGYFAEIAPAVYIRGTFDLAYREGKSVIVQDYKTFEKAPSLDDGSNQGKEYVVIAATGFGVPVMDVTFRWEYVRRELGRFLKVKKGEGQVFVEWPDEDRYYRLDMIVSRLEEDTIRRELYECALDIRATIENQRFYRTWLWTGPHGCGGCLYRDLCSTEFQHGALTPDDLAMFTQPPDDAERCDVATILADPRVAWYERAGISKTNAIKEVYGAVGVEKAKSIIA
ncbi:MAG: PD-(D/E)XK nuclease family protein [Patescibacteria group bacterium]|nr:PD-(D/E)XK nuclease family protein [Patescibacteria group bacterium]